MKLPRLHLLAAGTLGIAVCTALCLGSAWAFCAQPGGKLTWEAVFAWIARDWPGVPQMTTAELARRLGEKGERPVLIDTRAREEYAVSHLPVRCGRRRRRRFARQCVRCRRRERW